MSLLPTILIDRGGTFTDAILVDPEGGPLRIAKLPSSEDAPERAVRELLALPAEAPTPPVELRMGTTLATNALLEHTGAPAAMVITRGFGDALEVGHQNRPELFALRVERARHLYRRVIETEARADAQGRVLAEPEDLRPALRRALQAGVESAAVVVLHGHSRPELELAVAEQAREVGFSHVVCSHQVERRIGLIGRGDTTVVDAALTPVLAEYLHRVERALPGSRILVMQSSGHLVEPARFRGHQAILSGPAGGVVAIAALSEHLGRPLIGLDMGGTSTDVTRVEGALSHRYETEVAGVRLRTPMLDVHTIAAGGGSLCKTDGASLTVGPESAGARPGPLVYGHPEATALTLTDVNFVLGRVVEDRFPIPLHGERAVAALETIAAQLAARGIERSLEVVAEGFVAVANAHMAEAIRRVSTARGRDPRRFGLLIYGGAGGQHACDLARRLGITDVFLHPESGVLSALGMGLAPLGWHGEHDLAGAPLTPATLQDAERAFQGLEQEGRAALSPVAGAGVPLELRRQLDLRYAGTETALGVAEALDAEAMATRFHELHERELGYARRGHPIQCVTARLHVSSPSALPTTRPAAAPDPARTRAYREGRPHLPGAGYTAVPVWRREDLPIDRELAGPLLVTEAIGTVVVEPGFVLRRRADDLLHLFRRFDEVTPSRPDRLTERDPVLLELMSQRFMAIAEQMGEVLRRTALSTNIRDRLDFSCALFDAQGALVANAPHIPVHLGAMSESVRAVVTAHPEMNAGEVFVTNDPAAGGSHLPDITVVSPVFIQGRRRFFVANRGHHADVGGITPGSMPAFSRHLSEEGVVFRALRVVRGGALDEAAVLAVLRGGPHPARDPAQNLQDLVAQIAANRAGIQRLEATLEEYGLERVATYMQHVQDHAAERVQAAIAGLSFGSRRFEDRLDDGTPIVVSARIAGGRLELDFTGTGPECAGNLNAPRAVSLAAVLYVLRLLVGEPIPLNEGCLRHVDVRLPEGCLLNPGPERAVAGGNVETSQRVVDVLLAALGLSAASQGTMNNLSFGNERFGYYETLGGGTGAGPDFDGASAVHSHMTNTRLTDPEILESRFPVRVLETSIRRGSGGAGRRVGGDGLVRELEFLEPVVASILSERRVNPPFGLEGGGPARVGSNSINGRAIAGKATQALGAGDRLRVETPGGGGFGAEASARPRPR